jgi:transposase-like protein
MKTVKKISDSDRMLIIQEHLNGSSKSSVARKYNLSGPRLISRWMSIFGIVNPKQQINPFMNPSNTKESEDLMALRNELKQVKLALYREKMRADFNETMVDVAEEMFNIPIRKKAGTK